QALQIATIVKTTQNALIGIVAIALTAYFACKVERQSDTPDPAVARPSLREFWDRFPKFVLGFIAASVIGTLYLQFVSDGKTAIATVNDLRTWFLIFAFVAIGLEFSLRGLKEAGWRPIVLFAAATVVNIVVALGLASLLFGGLFGSFGTG
nr:putative sulfate exporter family transporter [Streptomyces sp. DSM 41633]